MTISPSQWACGHCRVDMRQERLLRDGQPVQLRPKAWALLVLLLRRANTLVPSAELFDSLWPRQEIDPKALTNLVSELRKALGTADVLQSVPRRGFILSATAISASPSSAEASAGDAAPRAAPLPSSHLCQAPAVHVARPNLEHALMAAAAAASEGRPQIIELIGAAGAGKTRLAECIAADLLARSDGWTILSARALDMASEPEPFGIVLELLQRRMQTHGRDAVVGDLRQHAPCWLMQFPNCLDADEQSRLRLELHRAGAGRIIREAVALMLHWASQSPLLLVLEDLHWADAATVDWLLALSRLASRERLLVLATRRGHTGVSGAERITSDVTQRELSGAGRALAMVGLDTAQVADFLRQLGVEPALANELAAPLTSTTGGLPFYVKIAADEIAARQAAGRAPSAADMSFLGDASQLRRHVMGRIAGMSAKARSALDFCACLAVPMPAPLLAACLQSTDDQVLSWTEAGVRAGLLVSDVEPTLWCDGRYVQSFGFAHDLFRQVVRDAIPPESWQMLNGRVASLLAAEIHQLPSDWATHLSLAYANAGMHAEAVKAFRQSSARSLSRIAARSAAIALKAALRHLEGLAVTEDTEALRLELWWELARIVAMEKGSTDPEVEALRDQITAHGGALASARAAFLVAETTSVRQIFGGRADLAYAASPALLSAAGQLDDFAMAQAYMWAGSAAMACGRIAQAAEWLQACVDRVGSGRGHLTTDLRLHAGVHQCWTQAQSGRTDEFLRCAMRLDAEMAGLRSSYLRAVMHFWVGDALRQLGCHDAARVRYALLMELCEFHDIAAFRFEAKVGMALSAPPAQRNLDVVRDLLRTGLSDVRRWSSYKIVVGAIETCLAFGDGASARQILEQGREIGAHWPFHRTELMRLEGDLLAAEGRLEAGAQLWRDALRIDADQDFLPGVVRGIARLGARGFPSGFGAESRHALVARLRSIVAQPVGDPAIQAWISAVGRAAELLAVEAPHEGPGPEARLVLDRVTAAVLGGPAAPWGAWPRVASVTSAVAAPTSTPAPRLS